MSYNYLKLEELCKDIVIIMIGCKWSNRVYVLLLILIGILTAAFFIGGYRRANGNIDEYGNEITEGTSVDVSGGNNC